MDKAGIITIGVNINTNLRQNSFGLALAAASQKALESSRVVEVTRVYVPRWGYVKVSKN